MAEWVGPISNGDTAGWVGPIWNGDTAGWVGSMFGSAVFKFSRRSYKERMELSWLW